MSFSEKIKELLIYFKGNKATIFLTVISTFAGCIAGLLIKKYLIITGGSIFLVCGATIAAILSYLAIESNREIKEKETERKDLESIEDLSIEMPRKLSKVITQAHKLIEKTSRHAKLVADAEKAYKSRISEKGKVDAIIEELKTSKEDIKKEHAHYKDKINELVDNNNRMSLLYFRTKNNHTLDDINIDNLSSHFEEFVENFTAAKNEVHQAVFSVLSNETSKEEISYYKEFSIDNCNFPNSIVTYKAIEETFKSPGLHIHNKSKKYQKIQARCLAISLFFISIALINGFSIKPNMGVNQNHTSIHDEL